MCCDGVLFHSVLLQSGDSSRKLASFGLKIKTKKGRSYFLQPCPAHERNCCRIYEDRPLRCRIFNCQQLLRLFSGESTEAQALSKIQEARRQVDHVNHLIDRLSETNRKRGLAQRCAQALQTDTKTPHHSELETAMEKLALFLENEFRVKPGTSLV
jgi:Fe-S-cluster containining protein